MLTYLRKACNKSPLIAVAKILQHVGHWSCVSCLNNREGRTSHAFLMSGEDFCFAFLSKLLLCSWREQTFCFVMSILDVGFCVCYLGLEGVWDVGHGVLVVKTRCKLAKFTINTNVDLFGFMEQGKDQDLEQIGMKEKWFCIITCCMLITKYIFVKMHLL